MGHKSETRHKFETSLVYIASSRGKKKINFHVIQRCNVQTEFFWNEQESTLAGLERCLNG